MREDIFYIQKSFKTVHTFINDTSPQQLSVSLFSLLFILSFFLLARYNASKVNTPGPREKNEKKKTLIQLNLIIDDTK